ncbi:hypothetical protein MML48_1g12419 [Holotrichia oblita]|uniref:Uncharacterized protein n=1 Tax=Holotrichia oblita TaxID=644536 RepID=A0ACB9TY91_HOLOL|nr:hypothetical protein MML48_1g12419 [Holotrichia oblita]
MQSTCGSPKGEPISGPLICEKALQVNEKLNGPKDFNTSSGWLKNFKTQHGIRELDIQGETFSSDLVAGCAFVEKFKQDALAKGYSRGDVYNADETGINWTLPADCNTNVRPTLKDRQCGRCTIDSCR